MKASDVMTRSVVVIGSDSSVLDAAKLMLEKQISGLPVVDSRAHLLGIVTEGDLLRRPEIGTSQHWPRWIEFLMGPRRPAATYIHSHGRKVAEVMTRDPLSIDEEAPIDDVVRLMEDNRIKRVPVTRKDKVIGVISRRDLIRVLVDAMTSDMSAAMDDREIRDCILTELAKQSWTPLNLSVTVRDGKVDLDGIITDERQREALKVVIENTPGVKAVNDLLVWIDPVSGAVMDTPEEIAKRATR